MRRFESALRFFFKKVTDLFREALVLLVKGYQILLSPLLGSNCRYLPSCSDYMIGCISRHGLLTGLWLGSKRIFKCHPLYPGGYDPVP